MKQHKTLWLTLAAAAAFSACGGGGGEAGSPPPVVTTSTASNARYSETLLVTLVGSNLDQALTLESTGCRNFVRSTTAPNVSSASTAYYTCTVSGATGNLFVTVSGGGITAATVPFTVARPEVTMLITNGAAVSGTLLIELRPDLAPQTVDNFLAYVKSGFYNNTAFHRNGRSLTGGDFVVQGGGYDAPISSATGFPLPKPTNAAIPLERALSHLRYTVGMARGSATNSATSQFFFNTADNTFLDGDGSTNNPGYSAFGTVTTGTAVVDAMSAAPCTASPINFGLNSLDCLPEPNLRIASAQQSR
jgi:cyclophilin family peptidyl-prolyl cis-trans isomerase